VVNTNVITTNDESYEMAENIAALQVVAIDGEGKGIKADHSNSSAVSVRGIASADTSIGSDVVIERQPVTWPGGGLTAGQSLFLGTNGSLTTTPPTTGWLRQVAVATDADTIVMDVGMAYFLGT